MISQGRSTETGPQPASETRSRPPRGPHPLGPLAANLLAIRGFAVYYLRLQSDAVKLRVRRLVLAAVLGLVAAITAAAGLVTAVVLLLLGAARGVALLFGGRAWAGDLAVGGGVVLLAVLVLYFMMAYMALASRRKAVEEYEHQRSQQRSRFGRDVSQRVAGG